MKKTSMATPLKIVIGYVLLIGAAVFAVWYIYQEILISSLPEKGVGAESEKILGISDAVARLYSAENLGRQALLEVSEEKFEVYNLQIDSVRQDFDRLKEGGNEFQVQKLDSLSMLILSKQKGMSDILQFRIKHKGSDTFNKAVSQLTRVKDSLNSKVVPVEIRNGTQLQQFLNRVLTPAQRDSLSRLPVSNEELTKGIEHMLTQLIIRDNKIKYRLYQQEERLQEESQIISDQIRVLVTSLQDQIVKESVDKIKRSRQTVSTITDKMTWVGIACFVILVSVIWMVIRDIIKSQKYRDELERLNHDKEGLLRSKTMLMATVTHDIQTPLGSVIGFTDLIRGGNLTEKQLQYLDHIKNSSDYIVRLVNDLIDFSKLENNRIRVEKVPFNMQELITSTGLSLLPNAQAKHIDLKWEIAPELNHGFLSDPYRIKQVLTNLISNGIKFTQKGGVYISAKTIGNEIEIEVADTGIGIAKDNQKDIFREFTQAHSGIEKKFGGTGLGLTIAKRMLHLLGGSISLESEEDKGATFTIRLPKVEVEIEKSTHEIPLEKSVQKRNKRLLIIDDDITQLALMKEIFQNQPLEIVTENVAERALKLIEKSDFDLVITDIQMPDMDGFELVKGIRQMPDAKKSLIPVLALSGKRDLNRDDFLSKGFTDIHAKPMQLEKLLNQISAILGLKLTQNQISFVVVGERNSLYDLSTLNQFTQGDSASLNYILKTFIDSSKQNVSVLKSATESENSNQMAAMAHKMIPMLKQLHAQSLVDKLIPIEIQKWEDLPESRMQYVLEFETQLHQLLKQLESEIN